ncbi:MAG: hydantoinase/oxoprolinase N-terminal domain-containing protein, partial [Campylobacterota bacterium]|nr:hydantoinase/oxoprolinase N-terminal domain-containing protein [Campylobacterota bacterium]
MVSFSIDRGGTFTDVYATYNNQVTIEKLLSVDQQNYPDAPVEGIRRILERILDKPIQYGEIDPSHIKQIRMGTTVATNALLERKGSKSALLITQGFSSALEIGYQNRPKLFELNIQKPSLLYKKVVEVDERVVVGVDGLEVEKAIDTQKVKTHLQELKDEGFESIAVVLMHADGFDYLLMTVKTIRMH